MLRADRKASRLAGARVSSLRRFFAHLADQFDVVIHCDVTRAVEPLERFAPVVAEELPETYPWCV